MMAQAPPTSLPSAPRSSLSGEASASSTPSTPSLPNLPNMKGYPKDITQSPVEEKFLCGHCDLILRHPMQSRCGHRFCASCREDMSKSGQQVRCKACIKEGAEEDESILDFNTMFDDKAAIREMKKIPVKCTNAGCTWKGTFQDYSTGHENNCDKKMVPCSLCTKMISQSKLNKHETSECPKRAVTCQHCKENMLSEQLDKHLSLCPRKPVKCDKCAATVPRGDMQNHKENECINREVNCPVPDCTYKGPLDQLPLHIGKSQQVSQRHQLYLFMKLEELERNIRRLEQEPELQGGGAVGGASGSVPQRAMLRDSVDEAGAEGGAVSGLTTDDKQKLKLHEDLMAVLHGEILRIIKQLEAMTTTVDKEIRTSRDTFKRIEALERNIGSMEGRLQEALTKIITADQHEVGTLINMEINTVIWRIDNFAQIRRAACNGSQAFVCSPPFTTGPCGYKLRARFFADGDGSAKGDAFSMYIQFMKSACDDLMPWPFNGKVFVSLLDVKEMKNHRTVSFSALPNEAAYQKPASQYNPSSGLMNFIKLKEFSDRLECYSVRDAIFWKITVVVPDDVTARLNSLDSRQVRR